ncbi:MAG TPA: SUMF1/EgtB/PvdO family nonheme iron enzyme [Thermoanaerobaculia bacterium]|nr:SUMF1/EgtB/PvdO family nonheme iron enzyme [Thermoanaerobaculia bacterium]
MLRDRDELISTYRAYRARTHQLFDLFPPEAYYARPIALRNPVVFYEGHLPGFCVNTLVKLTLKREGVDERLETLFARGIDPEDETAVKSPGDVWPSREEVQAFAAACDAKVEDALRTGALEGNSEAVFTIFEHELMHQETLMYMLHASGATGSQPVETGGQRAESPSLQIAIPAGKATLGATRDRFGWDNEFPRHTVDVDAFTVDAHNVTNGDYLEFMHATGASAPHFWEQRDGEWLRRGMFTLAPLPLDAAVYVTHDEAVAFARWKGKRLPTEAEFHRAAYGTPSGEERLHPWGDDPPDSTRGNFDFAHWDPVAIGSYPRGASAWGVHDLVGNGWEWTSSLFAGFDGFTPMPSYPEYSADFFDNAHYVLKGASPVTPRQLVRRSFRNWFRPNYPYVFATFRCVA